MIKVLWSLICSRSVIDIDSNNVSIQNIIEEILIKSPPEEPKFLLPIEFEIITLWQREEREFPVHGKGRIRAVAPNGDEIGNAIYEINLMEYLRSRNRTKFNGLPVLGPGIYKFIIEIQKSDDEDWKMMNEVELYVKFQYEKS